jgi:Zn-dependent protease with chaperone function
MTNSFWATYAVQAFLHSIVTAVLVNSALLSWNFLDPAVKQRFRFLALALPLVSFPLFHTLVPERRTIFFRLESLFDSTRWLSLQMFGVSLLMVLMAIFALTALVFIVQELIPIITHFLQQRQSEPPPSESQDELDEQVSDKLVLALEPLPLEEDRVEIIDDDDLYLYSSTGLDPRVFISVGLVQALDTPQLSAALAHETAHILRNRKPMLVVAYLLRALLFFNPIIMTVFRKMAHEEEQVCDDIAARITGDTESLAQAVELFSSQKSEPQEQKGPARKPGAVASLEEYSHDLLLQSRAARLREGISEVQEKWKLPFVLTMAGALWMSYFIV